MTLFRDTHRRRPLSRPHRRHRPYHRRYCHRFRRHRHQRRLRRHRRSLLSASLFWSVDALICNTNIHRPLPSIISTNRSSFGNYLDFSKSLQFWVNSGSVMRLNNVFFLGIDCLREILNQQSTLNFDLFFFSLRRKSRKKRPGK